MAPSYLMALLGVTAYLNRIHADILTDIDNYQIRTNFWGDVKDYGLTGLDYVDSNEKEKKTHIGKYDLLSVRLVKFQSFIPRYRLIMN